MILTRFGIQKQTLVTIVAFVLLVGLVYPSTEFYLSNPSSLASHSQTGVSNTETPSHSIQRNNILSDESFGDQQLFWVIYPEGAEQELATLLSVGTHCYIYMANTSIEAQGESNAITKCDELRDVFDSDVYPKDVELAGNPDGNLGDIDGDPKVTIFLGPFVEHLYAGRYDPMNEVAGTYSNYREMVMIDATRTINDMICLAIHEFNHLIWFNHEMDEADFLVEGLANFAIQYSGYWGDTAEAQARRFTDNPQDSLLFFNRISEDFYWDVSYGESYLFVTYLYERFGLDFVRGLVSIPEDGALAVDVALSNGGYDLTFNDVFLDWIVACTLDNPEIYEGIYGFTSVNYTINYQYSAGANYPLERSDVTFNYYGIRARRLYSPLDSMTLKIENPISDVLGIAIAVLDDEGWHITQTLHTEQSTEVLGYIEGTNVQEAYLIMSLMSENTPSEFGVIYNLDEIPSVELDYRVIEGSPSNSTEIPSLIVILGNYFIPLTGTVILLVFGVIVTYRRKTRNLQMLRYVIVSSKGQGASDLIWRK